MSPYLIPQPALIAFSGGRTSAYLLKQVLDAYGGRLPAAIVVAFCNTGKEHEATLRFVHECETRWDVKVWWLEFDPECQDRTKIVDFTTAARNGEPLAKVIETRPTQHLFNPVSRYCSPTAKARRMQKLMHWRLGYDSWHVALGLRADEMIRVERAKKRAGRDREWPIAPLAEAGVTKFNIKAYWDASDFDLQLPNVGGITPMGNCIMCPLKARAKLINALRVMPSAADWWIAQEDRMETVVQSRPRRDIETPERRHRFHKDGTSYRDLLAEAARLNSVNAPMDEGYDAGIDCLCTD